eukprot:scaffold5438_cov237-Pinguiococcus_pyrenoidosus.AAC.10
MPGDLRIERSSGRRTSSWCEKAGVWPRSCRMRRAWSARGRVGTQRRCLIETEESGAERRESTAHGRHSRGPPGLARWTAPRRFPRRPPQSHASQLPAAGPPARHPGRSGSRSAHASGHCRPQPRSECPPGAGSSSSGRNRASCRDRSW